MRGQLVASSLGCMIKASLVVDCVREINNLNNELSALDNDTLAANLCILFINWMEGGCATSHQFSQSYVNFTLIELYILLFFRRFFIPLHEVSKQSPFQVSFLGLT